jgi:competence protein ComEC
VRRGAVWPTPSDRGHAPKPGPPELDAARRRAGLTLPDGLTERAAWLGRLLSDWAIAEVAPGRLLPWLPVAYGFGIVVYFTADREPAAWAAAALALGGIIAAFMARRRAFGFAVALGFAATAAGFATATLQTARIAHSVLAFPASITNTVGYTAMSPEPFKDLWR